MSWRRHLVKHLVEVSVSNVDKKSAAGEIPVRLVNYTDVYYGDRLAPSPNLMQATASPRQVEVFRLRPGDVVITKDSETAEDIGVPAYVEASADDMVLGYHVALLRPRQQSVDGRYLYWAMCADDARGQLSTGATGVTRFGLRTDVITSTVISVPTAAEQKAIADFLDTETSRIDALITKKRWMVDLLRTKLDAERSGCLWGDRPAVVPLTYLTPPDRRIMYGIVLPGPDVDDGVPIVKGGDVAAGLTRKLCRTTREIESGYRRSRLRQGDLVFAIRGGIGDVAMVPTEVAGANITQDVARVAPAGGVEPRWLFHVLKSPEVQRQAQMRTTGATIHGLNIWELKRLHVPDRDVERQRFEAAQLDRVERRIEAVASKLRHQAGLLSERRQALITAAVTGELQVPGVAV